MKKQPERLCCVCRTSKKKTEMLRIVRDKEGNVSIDETGKMPGRGSYICASSECLGKARKQRCLERSLKAKLDETLWLEIETMLAARVAANERISE